MDRFGRYTMHVTIIKTGSTSLNVLVIYRRLTELMITPVRGRRDAFINTAGFHRECRCFSRYQKDRRNISPSRRCFLTFFLFFSSSLLFLFFYPPRINRTTSMEIFFKIYTASCYLLVIFKILYNLVEYCRSWESFRKLFLSIYERIQLLRGYTIFTNVTNYQWWHNK